MALAIAIVLAAFVIRVALGALLDPYVWSVFYPAVFIASWVGGLRAGIVATALSAVLVWVFVLPPTHTIVKEGARYYLTAAIFVATGVVFSLFHDRLRKATIELTRLYHKTRELDEIKTKVFAHISHELRSPLALILGPAEKWLAAPASSDELRRDLGLIQRNARTLLHHINDFLEVAKLEAHELTTDYAQADVARLVRFVAALFEGIAEQQQIGFTIEVPASAIAEVDPEMMRRIVQNLLSNAFKFTPRGGKVRITLRERAAQLVLEVADDGPGVPSKLRDLVFVPLRQLDEGSRRRFGGIGLGLAIVRELVALHHGTVTIADAPEGGALFVVGIPREAPRDATVRPRSMADDAGVTELELAVERGRGVARPTTETSTGPLVLVVEDNPEMNEFLIEALSSIDDYRVRSARDGREALAIATTEHPDLIITDVMMPGLSGDELVHAIRRRPELDTTPIVMLTAKADDRLRVEMLRRGADDYLTKPFSMEELSARVANLLARKRAEEETSRQLEQIEGVTEANSAVSDAIAGLPSSSVNAVLQTIALKAQALIGCRYVAVGIGSDPDVPFDPWVTVGVSPEHARAIGFAPRPIGLLGIVATGEEPVRVRDVRSHPAFRGMPANHPIVSSFLGVPIRYRGRTVGNLFLGNKHGADEFSEHDERIVAMLAARVGAAIETARLYRSEGMERAWLQAVVDQLPEGVVLLNATGHVIAQNRAAIGVLPDVTEAMGLELPDGSPIERADVPGLRALASGDAVRDLELAVRRPDGTRLPLLVSAAPVRGPDGTLAGATMVLRDITPQKEIARLRDEWSEIVAHDLQQPVNAIRLGIDLLLRGQLATRDRETATRVRDSIARFGRMIEDLKDVSALETGRLSLAQATIELGAFVRDVVARSLDVRGRVAVAAPRGPVLASCDSARLEQVLTNLLSNAAKYGDRDTPIEVAVQTDGAYASIVVRNQGAGIAPDELATLFDRYTRTRAARRSGIPGTGLGLYIARGVIEAHGGRIWATSTGGTTTFQLTLPIAASAPVEEPIARRGDAPAAHP